MAFFVEASLCDEAQRVRQQVDANGWDLVNMQVVLGRLFDYRSMEAILALPVWCYLIGVES